MRRIPLDEAQPGHFEIDLVHHCGVSASGEYVHTLQWIDVATGWSERVAILGRSYRVMEWAFRYILARLPFPILELHPDNGSEFLNQHLIRFFHEQVSGADLSRSRPYHKNDNRKVEQKNSTLVRALIGHDRLDTVEHTGLLNQFYDQMWLPVSTPNCTCPAGDFLIQSARCRSSSERPLICPRGRETRVMELASLIRDVPDFPVPGILFKDITTLVRNPAAFREVITLLTDHYAGIPVDVVAAIESRGFIFGAPLAVRLGAGFVPVRKPGKLPARSISDSYALEYGTNTLEATRGRHSTRSARLGGG